MNVGSLFSGIGGLELALESFGHTTLWQVESDPYARGVLAHHWPDVERFDDVRTVGAANLRAVDVICGGFPCQDISNAGTRSGLGGKRSGLWGEFARIVGVLRPRYVFVENSAALTIRGLERGLGDLAALDYDAEGDVFSAAQVGAPHQRRRYFLLAHTDRFRELQPEGCLANERGRSGDGRATIPNSAGLGRDNGWRFWSAPSGEAARPFGDWRVEPDVGRVAARVPARVDRLRCLGNAVVPAQAAFAWQALMARLSLSPALSRWTGE